MVKKKVSLAAIITLYLGYKWARDQSFIKPLTRQFPVLSQEEIDRRRNLGTQDDREIIVTEGGVEVW